MALLVLVAGTVLVNRAAPSSASGPGVAGGATVTASSTAAGYSARDLVSSGSSAEPGRPWRATGGVGSWVDLAWPTRFSMRQIVLVQDGADRSRVREGYLTFGDGSRLLVQLTSQVTVVPITERSVDRVRFTVSRLAPGTDVAGLGELLVNSDVPSPGVQHGDVRGGDVAPTARVTASKGGSDPGVVTAPPAASPDTGWTTRVGPGGTWIQMDWNAPRELAAVQLAGAQGGAGRVASGTLSFSDGSVLPVGAVPADARLPTTVAFMPRVVTSLRLTVDAAAAGDMVTLSSVRAYESGNTPLRPMPPSVSAGPVPAVRAAAGCATPAATTGTLAVACPQNGAVVDGAVAIRVSGAAGRTVVTATVWPSDTGAPPGDPVAQAPDTAGDVDLSVDAGPIAPGPFTVQIRASGGGEEEQDVYLQLYRAVSGPAAQIRPAPAADGRTLAYDEEFDRPLSVSRSGDGSEYTAAKPVHDGVQDFGDAVFVDPGSRPTTLSVVDDRFLRIAAEPLPPGARDPRGWGRTSAAGMLASARPGGSGFSAQYGYFEARMYAPAAPGTWPAFWALPSDNLIAPTPSVAEIDAVELYGHEPRGACMSTHEFRDGKDGGKGQCRNDLFASERAAMAWHTYGVSIGPDVIEFWVDGRLVTTAPQVYGGAAPMFFLVDLALGGGWPVNLGGTQGRADLYVDYVRVYV